MATLTDPGTPTLLNVLKRLDPNGGIAKIAEVLEKFNPILQDIPWTEGNLATGHRVTDRTALPSVAWRKLNAGVSPTKSETAQFDEVCGMLEAYSRVDVDVAALNGNSAAFRFSEAKAFLEAMNQEFATAVFYHSALTTPEKIHGLSPRYSATTGITAAAYVLKKGTVSGINAQSIWLINWDPERIHGIYPKGSMGGLQQKDLGEQLITDANGAHLRALVEHFQWKCGICVRDYRYACRMQWDPDDTATHGDSAKSLYLAMQEMLGTVYNVGAGARFYMSRTSYNKLNAQLASNSANFLEYVDAGGKRIPSFMGVPVRVVDALTPETAIV